jgi:hypothetical protein
MHSFLRRPQATREKQQNDSTQQAHSMSRAKHQEQRRRQLPPYMGDNPVHRLSRTATNEVAPESLSMKNATAPPVRSQLPPDGRFVTTLSTTGAALPEINLTSPNNAVRVEGTVNYSGNRINRRERMLLDINLLEQPSGRFCRRSLGFVRHGGRFLTTFGGLPPGRYSITIFRADGQESANVDFRGRARLFNLPEQRRRRHGRC